MRRLLLLLLLLALSPTSARAHPLDPAVLHVAERAAGVYLVEWRHPLAWSSSIAPKWPADCRASTLERQDVEGARRERSSLTCGASLAGRSISVAGLAEQGLSCFFLFVPRAGRAQHGVLTADTPAAIVATAPSFADVFVRYLMLGAEHLWTGADHLLFLLGIALLLLDLRRTAWALSAFTLGHSVTLAAAALSLVRLPAALVEVGIALSLILLALELVGALRTRAFGPLSCVAFGLLHGLGFAGALGGVGLVEGQLVSSLASFNLGIELAQLSVLLLASPLLFAMARTTSARARSVQGWSGYAIGAAGAMWCMERATAFF